MGNASQKCTERNRVKLKSAAEGSPRQKEVEDCRGQFELPNPVEGESFTNYSGPFSSTKPLFPYVPCFFGF